MLDLVAKARANFMKVARLVRTLATIEQELVDCVLSVGVRKASVCGILWR